MERISSKRKCLECKVHSITLLNKLNVDEINYLDVEKECLYFKKNEIIYKEGVNISGCYFINEGVIKLYSVGVKGKEQIIKLAKKGDVLGYRALFNEEKTCHTAKVLEDTIVCFVPKKVMFDLVIANSNFALDLLKFVCKELYIVNNLLKDIAQKTVKERLSTVLLNLIDDFGLDQKNFLKVSISRNDLANLIGTAPENVIRTLNKFKELNYIETLGRKIKIVDKKALEKIANNNYLI